MIEFIVKFLLNLVTDNCLFDGKKKLLIKDKNDLDKILRTDLEKLFILIGPCSYTSARKAIAIGKAIGITTNTKIYGIDILNDFMKLFSNFNSFIFKNHIWTADEDFCTVNLYQEEIIDQKYSTNIKINNNKFIDCSTENIFLYLDRLENPLRQEYFDKFSKIL